MKKAEEQPVAAIGSRRAVRVLGIAVIAAIVGLIVSYGAMTIGYILVVVVLSTSGGVPLSTIRLVAVDWNAT